MLKRILLLVCLLLFAAVPVIAEVSESLSYKTYTVEHEAGTSLQKAINSASSIRIEGKTYHGFTSWNIKWSYRFRKDGNGRCSISQNKTTLTSEIDEEILSLPRMDSCDELTERANQLGRQLVEQTRQKQRNYDQETQHGRTQGARLQR